LLVCSSIKDELTFPFRERTQLHSSVLACEERVVLDYLDWAFVCNRCGPGQQRLNAFDVRFDFDVSGHDVELEAREFGKKPNAQVNRRP